MSHLLLAPLEDGGDGFTTTTLPLGWRHGLHGRELVVPAGRRDFARGGREHSGLLRGDIEEVSDRLPLDAPGFRSAGALDDAAQVGRLELVGQRLLHPIEVPLKLLHAPLRIP